MCAHLRHPSKHNHAHTLHTHMHTHRHTYTHVHTHFHTQAHFRPTPLPIPGPHPPTLMHTLMHMHTRRHTYTHVHTHFHTQAHCRPTPLPVPGPHPPTLMHTPYTHTCTHAGTHTHMFTHISTHRHIVVPHRSQFLALIPQNTKDSTSADPHRSQQHQAAINLVTTPLATHTQSPTPLLTGAAAPPLSRHPHPTAPSHVKASASASPKQQTHLHAHQQLGAEPQPPRATKRSTAEHSTAHRHLLHLQQPGGYQAGGQAAPVPDLLATHCVGALPSSQAATAAGAGQVCLCVVSAGVGGWV